jgi:hypothetical protein
MSASFPQLVHVAVPFTCCAGFSRVGSGGSSSSGSVQTKVISASLPQFSHRHRCFFSIVSLISGSLSLLMFHF